MSSPLDEAVKLRHLRRLVAEGSTAVARGDYDDVTSEEEAAVYFQVLEQEAEARPRPPGRPGNGP